MKKDVWIAGIARGHNSGVCLLKNGEIIFTIEEERLSRHKYDGGPLAAMVKILEYTDKLDHLVIAHTQSVQESAGRIDFSGDDVYTGLARKLGLIDRKENPYTHSQVHDLSFAHHKLHAACAFYRSGFDEATAVIVDGAGTFIPLMINGEQHTVWETESVFKCDYNTFTTVYKHTGTRGPLGGAIFDKFTSEFYKEFNEDGTPKTHILHLTDKAGITKVYEAVTQYCGFSSIEAGKTMGLSPYGKPNAKIPKLFIDNTIYPSSDRNVIIPTYPNGAEVNHGLYDELLDYSSDDYDLTKLQNRRDLAYALQTETQQQVLDLIIRSVKLTGNKNVVLSGGYGLNCVANYFYLEELNKHGINLYVEPISSDAGTAIGAAMMFYKQRYEDTTQLPRTDNLYLGPKHEYTDVDILALAEQYNATVQDATHLDVINLMTSKNIVANFQGRSENGPRALGNRSLMFDPTFKDGKDFVNMIKRREYFRPFAGSILEEDVHEWFDLRGMESSPTMMYAVNCQPGIEEKIPSIIHVDGTCRIQTVNREQNPHYYDIIKAFKEKTGCPIVFNTSFNLGGEPLVETLDDALWTLQQSEIEYLYLPEYGKLLTIKN
jgi:carbamoyltransferase